MFLPKLGTGTPILTHVPCFSCIYISTLTVPIHFVLCCCGCQQPQPADWLAQSCSCSHGSFLPSCFLFFWVFYFFCIMNNHVFRFFFKLSFWVTLLTWLSWLSWPRQALKKLAGPWRTPGSAQTRHERYLGPEVQRNSSIYRMEWMISSIFITKFGIFSELMRLQLNKHGDLSWFSGWFQPTLGDLSNGLSRLNHKPFKFTNQWCLNFMTNPAYTDPNINREKEKQTMTI